MDAAFGLLFSQRVLIVDDSPAITSLLKEVFDFCGAKTTVVNTGQAALFQLQLRSFDLVILDLIMPRPNGLDILSFMRRNRRNLLQRTILLTGDRYHDDISGQVAALKLPIIYKPFNIAELRATACIVLQEAAGAKTARAS